tara:strand:+ start:93 stop:761 length:669 start_codon:yes stop_codon:yes gene_type:complete
MSSTTKNISNTISTIPKFLVKLGKMGVENGILNVQMKTDINQNKKIKNQIYKALLKEVQIEEKEAIKVKKEARKVIAIVLKKHSNNIKNKQKAEKIKQKTIKVINNILKKHSNNIKGCQNPKKKVEIIYENVVPVAPTIIQSIVNKNCTENMFPQMTNTVGTANKFWKIVVNGSETCVTFGKTGTKGRSIVKDHEFENKAHGFAIKQVEIKCKGGYIADEDQ